MPPYTFKTLRGRLTALLIIPVVAILVIAGIAGFVFARAAMLEQWNQRVALQLAQAAHNIEMHLSRPLELMKLFSESGAAETSRPLLEMIIRHMDALPEVLRTDLTWLAPVPPTPKHGQPAASMGRRRFMRFHKGAYTRIAPPQIDRISHQQAVSVSMILLDATDTAVGHLDIVLKFDSLVSDLTRLGWWKQTQACIADPSTGDIVLASGLMAGRRRLAATADPLEKAVAEKIAGQTSGTVWGTGMPPDRIAGFHRLDIFPWSLVVFTDGRSILAPIIAFRNAFIIGALALMLIVYGIIRLNVNRISAVAGDLAERAVAVAAGDYGDPITVASGDEIGRLAASFNTMLAGLRERDAIRNTFGRYVDPDFARTLLEQPEAGRLGGRRQAVSILMADIRGFTGMAERLSPEATITMLNRYFSTIIPLVQKYRGIIIDFVGDGILAFFEPVGETDGEAARRCVVCAFAMQAGVERLGRELRERGQPQLTIGIGINSGPVVVGNIGSESRKKYGIVGAAVNGTQRIQSTAGGGDVVVSAAVLDMIAAHVVVKRRFSATLKGMEGSATLYAVAPAEHQPALNGECEPHA